MPASPDYKIINDCLEKVVRPTVNGLSLRYWPSSNPLVSGWVLCGDDQIGALTVDEYSALAVVEKAVRRWLMVDKCISLESFHMKLRPGERWWIGPRNDPPRGVEHADETTALCLLALRVAGESK